MMRKGREGESFNITKFIKEAKKPQKYDNIDDLNDETFGDGAIADDWETYHRAATNLDKNITTNNSKQWKEEGEEVLSKFQDMTLKNLWSDDSSSVASSSPSSSNTQLTSTNLPLASNIWSSTDIPSPSRRKDIQPTMRTVADLEREMASSPPLPPPLSSHIISSPHLSSSPSQLSTSPLSNHIPPPILYSSSSPTHTPPMRPPLFYPHPIPGPHPHHPHMMPPRGPHPPYIRGLPPNIPMMGPPRMIPRGALIPHPHMPHPPPPMGFRPYMHGRGPHPQAPPINVPSSLPRFPSKLNEMLCDLKPDGSGFMNQKEKEWVIKVQLLQLHTTSPEIDDYYYRRYIEKRLLSEHKSEGIMSTSDDKSMKNLTLPPPVNQDDKKRHKFDFENTLGKITTNSVSAPRKTIDISQSSSSSGEGLKKEVLTGSKKRRVLLTIEEMYNLLLKLDNLGTSDPLSVGQLQHEITDKIFDLTSLQNDLSTSDESAIKEGELFFQQILHFRKGKCVLQRVLPILSKEQAKIVLLCISKSIAIIVRKDTNDKVLPELIPCFKRAILTLNLSEVSLHVSLLTAAVTHKLTENTFFSEYFMSFISRGALLLEAIELSSEEAHEWSLKLKALQLSLLSLKVKPTSLLMEEVNKSLP